MQANHKIVIIPAFNEEKNLPNVLSELKEYDPSLSIVVVDDGSTDRTAQVARKLHVNVLELPFNLGIGGAVQTGLKYACKNGFEIAIQVDADGQHIASEIEKLLGALQEGYDVVIGSRFIEESNYHSSLMRNVGIKIIALVNSFILGKKITDNTSGFRAFNRRAISFLSRHYPVDYPEPETIIILGRSGFRMKEVPVKMRQRLSGESSIGTIASIYFMIKVLLAIFIDIFKQYEEAANYE